MDNDQLCIDCIKRPAVDGCLFCEVCEKKVPAGIITQSPIARRNALAKWDRRFLDMAKLVASWSKDPSTQTGAVIVAPDGRRVVSVGYNGFAQHVKDDEERYNNRELKYKMIVHCERNAIIFAHRDLAGCTLYTYPFMSCSVCAGMVIQAGIMRVVAPVLPADKAERWREDMEVSQMMFREAQVTVELLEYK